MGKVVRFRTRRRARLRAVVRPRAGKASWLTLGTLLGVSALSWLMAWPERSGVGGQAAFVLCAEARTQNCVIDGDTIRYEGVVIRLADIDAPEIRRPQCASEAARARKATRRLLTLMNDGPFRIVRSGRDVDRYGRKLRTIERDGRSLGELLVAQGLARHWDGARRSWCS